MKKIITSISTLLTLASSANYEPYKKLKPIASYSPSAYHLANGIKYLEVRSYNIATPSGKKPIIGQKYDLITVAKSTKVDKKLIEKLRKYPPIFTQIADMNLHGICVMSGCSHFKGNAFVIDSKNKMWKMDETSDVIKYLGEIDTEAELRLLLWMKSFKYDNSKYRKVKDGYEVVVEYSNDMSNVGPCGYFTYYLKVSKSGRVSQKLLSKSELEKGRCLFMD